MDKGGILTVLRLAVVIAGIGSAVRCAAEEPKFVWQDGTTVPIEGRAFEMTEGPYHRLPAEAKGRVTPAVWSLQQFPSGLAFRFKTTSPRLAIRWDLQSGTLGRAAMCASGVSGFDVYRRMPDGRWKFVSACVPTKQKGNFASWSWRPGEECLVNFPLYNGVTACQVGVAEGHRIEPAPPRTSKPLVFYGVSTTQGCNASRPGMSFPAIVSRRLDVPHVNLGFSGAGKMEMEMCDYVSQVDASVYVLDTVGNMPPPLLEERFEKFVRELHRRRPDVPLVFAGERFYDSSARMPGPRGRFVESLAERLRAEGGWTIAVVHEQDMFTRDVDETTVDNAHPTDFGMMQLADAYGKVIAGVLPKREER